MYRRWSVHLGKSSSSKILHPLCWQLSTSSSWETIIDCSGGKTPSQHQLAARPCPRALELLSSNILSRDSVRMNGVDIILTSKMPLCAYSFLNTIKTALIKSQSGEFFHWLPLSLSSDSAVKNLPANVADAGSVPGRGRSPGEGDGNPLQYLPGKSHGQRSLVGYNPRGSQQSCTWLSD